MGFMPDDYYPPKYRDVIIYCHNTAYRGYYIGGNADEWRIFDSPDGRNDTYLTTEQITGWREITDEDHEEADHATRL